MRWYWDNDKQPDENGNLKLVIVNAQEKVVSTFLGKDEDEMIGRLADSQVHANQKIATMMKPDSSGKEPLRQETKQLSPADRLRLSDDMTNPERVVEAVEEIVSARMGITPERVGSRLAKMDAAEQDRYFGEESKAFRLENPDFYPVTENRDAVFAYLKENQWDLTRNNLALAYQLLNDQGKLTPWPSDEEREQERNFIAAQAQPPNGTKQGGNGAATAVAEPPAPTPNARPRATSYSTGLRNADASATRPQPVKPSPKYTRADIERMSRTEFADKLRSEPGFKQLVDAMA